MLLWVAIAAALVLISANAYLQLRVLATGVGAPKGSRLRLETSSYQRPWLEDLGFRTVGELLYPGAGKNDPPIVEPALIGPDGITVARANRLRERAFTLLTAWPDGGYVLTRCPPGGPFTTRDSATVSIRSASSSAQALSLHVAAVRSFAQIHGRPMDASDAGTVAACFQTAASNYRRQLLRTYALAIPLGLLTLAVLVLAAVAR